VPILPLTKKENSGNTYVTPPMATQVIMAIGASRVGRGISSVICVMASYPIKERADCNRPSIQATPSGQPVSLVNWVKTNSAFVLGAVAMMTAEVATQAVRDQNTALH
jgi:hypothetical protein